MVTVSVQVQNKTFYAVIGYYPNGQKKRKQKWVSTGIKSDGNKKKATKIAEKLREDFISNLENLSNISDSKKDDILFCDYMLKWLEMIRHKIEETTYVGYSRIVKGKIYKYFNEKQIMLSELKPLHIIDFYESLYKENLKGTTVVSYHANIRQALDYAVKTELINSNPATRVDRPKAEQYIASHYNQEELNRLFEVVKDTIMEVPVCIAAFYGLRRSEVLGLKWDAIDFENKTITIKHKVVTVFDDDPDSKSATKLMTKDRTKNKSSYRTLPLVPDIENILKYAKKMQEYHQSICKKGYNLKYKDYICVNPLGELMKPDYVTHEFHDIVTNKDNGLRHIRFHDLRHSCATLLQSKGVNLRFIQAWMGHSSYQTTERYANLDSTSKELSASVIQDNLRIGVQEKNALDCDSKTFSQK